MSLRIESLTRDALSRRVLDRLSLEVRSGEFMTLLGAPGSGRNSLLRCVAGLEEADAGRILLDGRDITRLPPRRRGIAFLFQQDPLFGHPTVFDAVAGALPEPPHAEGAGYARGAWQDTLGTAPVSVADAVSQVRHMLSLVGLGRDENAMPVMLPPSKRHRLAVARALAAGPRVLMVGETFGVAGHGSGNAMPRRWLKELHQRLGLTTILIAQGASEALALGDRIAVLNAGRLEQVAFPAEILRRPASGVVAQALGNVVPMPHGGAISGGEAMRGLDPWSGHMLTADAVEVVEPGSGAPARVMSATAFGASLRLELELLGDGSRLEAEVPSLGMATLLPPGSIVGLRMRRPL
jgi:sulfate transport system ATP-binding protein